MTSVTTVVHVLDTETVIRIPTLIKTARLNECLDALTDHVSEGIVSFPDQVLTECKRIAAGETITMWLKAVAGSRQHHRVPYSETMKVLASCPNLLDVDNSDEPSSLAVAAMAKKLHDTGTDFAVVTEDDHPQPTRMCLAHACDELGFPRMDTMALMDTLRLVP